MFLMTNGPCQARPRENLQSLSKNHIFVYLSSKKRGTNGGINRTKMGFLEKLKMSFLYSKINHVLKQKEKKIC